MISSLCCRGMPWPLNVLGLWRPGWMRPLAACWAHSTPSCARLPRVPRPWLSSAHFVIDPLKKDISTDWMETINTMGSMGSMGSMVFFAMFFWSKQQWRPSICMMKCCDQEDKSCGVESKEYRASKLCFFDALMCWLWVLFIHRCLQRIWGIVLLAHSVLPTYINEDPLDCRISSILKTSEIRINAINKGPRIPLSFAQWPYGFWLKDGSQLFTAPLSY